MLDSILEPVEESLWTKEWALDSLGYYLQNKKANKIGAPKSVVLVGFSAYANTIRQVLYSLKWRFGNLEVNDLGNLSSTLPAKERSFAISELIAHFDEKGVICLVLHGREEDNFGIYLGLRNKEKPVELVSVTAAPNLLEDGTWQNLLVHKPSHLFNIDFMASQMYCTSEHTYTTLNQLYFENYRLGTLRENMAIAEPVMRSAQAVFFSMDALRCTDFPACGHRSPNGLYSEEAALLMRYAGISNCVQVFILQGGAENACETTEIGLAQSIWYFLEGASNRFYDHPAENDANFVVYVNKLVSSGHEIVFYKSKMSNRWWMKVPHPYKNYSFFIGCNYEDYQTVCNDEIPDRWWRAYQRLM